MWEIATFGYFMGLWTDEEFHDFCMILWISESFSLHLLVKNSFKFNFKIGFFTYLTYFKYISEYHQPKHFTFRFL